MTKQFGSVTKLIMRAEHGEESATAKLYRLCSPKLLAYVRDRINSNARQLADEEDIVQNIFADLFVRMRERKITFDGRKQLWGLLWRMVRLKIIDHYRQQGASPELLSIDENASDLELQASVTPEEEAICAEEVARMIDSLNEFDLKLIATLRLHGWTSAEIADDLKLTQRTIQRKIERIRKKWTET